MKVVKLCKVKSLNENKRIGEYKRKGCIANLYMKRAATGVAELELLPAEGGWIFNDPTQDAVITRGTDCHTGAFCGERPSICRLVLFMVPVPQVWHCIWCRSQGGEVTESGTDTAACYGAFQLQTCQKLSILFCCRCLLKPGTTRQRDLIRQESGVKGSDSLQFSGKLTSSQHRCEDIILTVYFCYLHVLWYHCGFLKSGLGAGSRKTIRGRNSAQVWKRLKHITKLTSFKDIFLTSKHPHPPPTCLPHSFPPISPSLFLNQDQDSIMSMT